MNIISITRASLFVSLAITSIVGCAASPDGGDGDDGETVAAVAQPLEPSEPCEKTPFDCGLEGGGESGPTHTNKGIVAMCRSKQLTCNAGCKGTAAAVKTCVGKCTKAHTECLDGY
jgi:hypothetical protein